MQHQASPKIHAYARALRHNMTDSERYLWARLRAEQLGVKFRRQHPMGRYIADFACLNPKLIIELDGVQHQAAEGYDAHRDAFFRAQGFEVLRFPSNAPFVDLGAVLQAILNQVNVLTQDSPHPGLPPDGEGVNTATYAATDEHYLPPEGRSKCP